MSQLNIINYQHCELVSVGEADITSSLITYYFKFNIIQTNGKETESKCPKWATDI
jgi:hypothetical protein